MENKGLINGTGGSIRNDRKISRDDYYEFYAPQKLKNGILVYSMVLYVIAGLTFVVGIVVQNLFVLIDIAIIIGLTVPIHLKRNRICSILLLIYGIIAVILSFASGQPSGWLVPIMAGMLLYNINNLDKEYEKFLKAQA